MNNELFVFIGHDSALECYTEPRTNSANEMIVFMNDASGAGFIAQPVDQYTSSLPLYCGHPPPPTHTHTHGTYGIVIISNYNASSSASASKFE